MAARADGGKSAACRGKIWASRRPCQFEKLPALARPSPCGESTLRPNNPPTAPGASRGCPRFLQRWRVGEESDVNMVAYEATMGAPVGAIRCDTASRNRVSISDAAAAGGGLRNLAAARRWHVEYTRNQWDGGRLGRGRKAQVWAKARLLVLIKVGPRRLYAAGKGPQRAGRRLLRAASQPCPRRGALVYDRSRNDESVKFEYSCRSTVVDLDLRVDLDLDLVVNCRRRTANVTQIHKYEKTR